MTKEYYMRPLSGIAVDVIEAIVNKDRQTLSELQKAVEFRIDALEVVGSTTDDEKRLVRALKRLKTDIVRYE